LPFSPIFSGSILVPLILTPEQCRQLETHARSTYPAECCGVLVGFRTDTAAQVITVHPTPNAWSPDALPGTIRTDHSVRDRYGIAPADLFAIMKSSRAAGWDIIGIYHSHPDHPAQPSECDRQLAWPEYCYVILAVTATAVIDRRGWQLDAQQQFGEVEIRVGHSA
jgi:proteasome lid subunit RPN8/RPN11